MDSIAVTITLITLLTITVYALAALSFLQIERESRRAVPVSVVIPTPTSSQRTVE